jgi:hypothetical protein
MTNLREKCAIAYPLFICFYQLVWPRTRATRGYAIRRYHTNLLWVFNVWVSIVYLYGETSIIIVW